MPTSSLPVEAGKPFIYFVSSQSGLSWTLGIRVQVEEFDSELYANILKTTYEDNVFTKPMEN